jgi:hypothetical protein
VGQVQTATGGAINYGALTFSLSQPAVVAGSATIATETSACYTSAQGNIVGIPDPVALPVLSASSSGTLPAGTYYVVLYYVGAGGVSAVSPEASINLSSQGSVIVRAPGVQPNSATGYGVAISTTASAETIQSAITGWTQYSQSTALVTGATPQALNTSFCSVYLSDQLIPTGTYYTVNLVNKNGSQIAGFPQSWCMYGGGGATINVSNGAPTGNCSTSGVFYPTPVFTNPPNALMQSIASGLSLVGTLNVGGKTTLNALTTTGNASFPGVTGNPVFSGSAIFAGANGVLNPASCSSVLPPSWCSGSDIGAWTNAAIATLPSGVGSTCGEIYVPAGSYSQTTQIVKPRCVKLHGPAGYGAQLIWNGSSSAFQVVACDNWSGSFPEGSIEDLTLVAGTSTFGGIWLGGDPANTECPSTYKGNHQNFNRVRVAGFATGLELGNNTWSITIHESAMMLNTAAIVEAPAATNSGEQIVISDSSINNNTAYAIYVSNSGYCPFYCWLLDNDSFDFNGNGTIAPIQTGFTSFGSYFLQSSGPVFDTTTSGGQVIDFGSTFYFSGSTLYFGKLTSSPNRNSFTGTTFNAVTANTDLFNGSSVPNLSGITLDGNAFSSHGTDSVATTLRANGFMAYGNPCTNGELALSAGWGSTAAASAVAGVGQTCQWTITSGGSGQAANPTITDTLTNPLPGATTVCEMRMVGGNGTATLINQTTLSSTAPVFTFGGTPVTSDTYFVVRRCGP